MYNHAGDTQYSVEKSCANTLFEDCRHGFYTLFKKSTKRNSFNVQTATIKYLFWKDYYFYVKTAVKIYLCLKVHI